MAGNWLQILKEIVPSLARVAVMFNPDTAPHSIFWPALEAAAPSVGVKLVRAIVYDKAGIESAIAALAGDPTTGLAIKPDVFTDEVDSLLRGRYLSPCKQRSNFRCAIPACAACTNQRPACQRIGCKPRMAGR